MSVSLSVFSVAEQTYEHFTVSAKTLTVLVWSVCAGILIAAVYMLYQKTVPGGVVRAILAAGAFSEECAKTATELGITGRLARRELCRNVTLKHLLRRGEKDGEETRYFIPEEDRYRAEVRYEREGRSPAVTLLLTAALTFLFGLLLLRLLPVFLTVADHLLNGL